MQATNSGLASKELTNQIDSLRGDGQPLPQNVREYFEPRFGTDFSGVRIHANSRASESAERLHAHAYTCGKDIVFGHNEYNPESQRGKGLLAHELTHVVQQGNINRTVPGIQKQTKNPSPKYRLGMRSIEYPNGMLEVEIIEPWHEGGGASSTTIGMATVAGISLEYLLRELVACGAYKNEHEAKYAFKVGTRIVIKDGLIYEISVRGKVYKVGNIISPGFDFFLKEGTLLFSAAGFGLSGGDVAGQDPADSYDASTWIEKKSPRGVLRAKVSPWLAIDRLVRSINKEVPKAGGGKTKWRFDCFEFTQLITIYALWRTMTKSQFNKKFTPLELGFFSRSKIGWSDTIYIDAPGGKPYKIVGGIESGGVVTGFTEIYLSKSIGQLVKEARIGSHIVWTNQDAKNKCNNNPNLGFCDFASENTIKLGQDKYAAHPFGILSEEQIRKKMAHAVIGVSDPAYIRANIYISSLRYPP